MKLFVCPLVEKWTQGEEVGSPTEEVEDLINKEEEEEEIGKEEPGSGMTGMISTLILDPLISAGVNLYWRNI